MNNTFPPNFFELHKGEEEIRCRSIAVIEENEQLFAHTLVIKISLDCLHHFTREYEGKGDDELTVQLLGIRLSNSAAAAFKLLLSGYYQNATAVQRDLIETTFLLDYLNTDANLISKWRKSDKAERHKFFQPRKVRAELDKRDGLKDRKRDQRYRMYCELASHPTYDGFIMLTDRPNDKAICGPFFSTVSMRAVLEELAIHMVQAATIFVSFFHKHSAADHLVLADWLEGSGRWYERFGGPKYNPEPVEEIRALLRRLSNH
ncbi:MAG TPA: hypothetical protein VHO48_13875 [Anaerolineaceae bacterium]|nr:hypothetical protein [Anaerolineaceae bacterium]